MKAHKALMIHFKQRGVAIKQMASDFLLMFTLLCKRKDLAKQKQMVIIGIRRLITLANKTY